MLIRGEFQFDAINSNFDNFESNLYMKSVSMPLNYELKDYDFQVKLANCFELMCEILNFFRKGLRFVKCFDHDCILLQSHFLEA